MLKYEERLNKDWDLALSEGSQFFEDKGAVQKALKRISARLQDLGIPYAVAGGMALYRHGHRRFTEDVDLLVNRESLPVIHEELEGLGYIAPFAKSKNLRDTESGVRIEFLIAGDYPGDGKPKPVAFPNPQDVSVELDGIRYLGLPTLIELKLASGMTHPKRGKDLVDVMELVIALRLPREFAEKLNPFVRDKFEEIWNTANGPDPTGNEEAS